MKAKIITLLFVVIFSIISCNQKHVSNTKDAKEIVKRAISLTEYIPDARSKELIKFALGELSIVETDKKGRADFSSDKPFVLLIAPAKRISNYNTGDASKQVTAFRFELSEMVKSHRTIIVMNNEVKFHSDNIDALACFLIHELIHAIQTNTRIVRGIKDSKEYDFADEYEAWNSMVYIYQKIHPEILKCRCNCDNLTVINNTGREIDVFEINFILFQNCRERFLKTMYK